MTQEMRSEVQKLLANEETYKRIWKSNTNDEWHWVIQFPNQAIHNYSGIAESEEQAQVDIELSTEHYIFVNRRHSLWVYFLLNSLQ